MSTNLAVIGVTQARPPIPTAVAQWHGERRIARRMLRQRRYQRITRFARAPRTSAAAVRTGSLLDAT
jgi:hypothetical protein